MLRYLLDQSLQKQLQIVFTTHAPTMIEGLPLGAVKVFALDPATEKFIVHQDRSAEEAFLSIGHRVTNKLAIRVEDRLAKALIEEAMKKMCADERLPHEFPALVDVVFYPGGVGSMKNDIIRYSREADINVRQIFDGSERPKETIELQKLTTEENQPSSLKQRLEQVVGQKITFAIDGGKGGGRADQELAAIHSYIRFWNERCFFLPFDVPEEVLWDRDLAKAQLEPVLSSPAELELELDRLDGCVGKVRFQELAKTLYNENASAQILAIQTYFLKAWLNRGEAAEIKQVEEIILKIRELVGFINGKSCSVES